MVHMLIYAKRQGLCMVWPSSTITVSGLSQPQPKYGPVGPRRLYSACVPDFSWHSKQGPFSKRLEVAFTPNGRSFPPLTLQKWSSSMDISCSVVNRFPLCMAYLQYELFNNRCLSLVIHLIITSISSFPCWICESRREQLTGRATDVVVT